MEDNKVFLITSGAYANSEIISDFGMLPSAFLPAGHKRLIELQLELIDSFKGMKLITLPDNYNLSRRDKELLDLNNIKVHKTNPNLNLSQSILSLINTHNFNSKTELYILHGDTYFESLDYNVDIIYYGFTDMFYRWGQLQDILLEEISLNNLKQTVISGYFTFSNISLLESSLNKYENFELALNNYNKKQPLKFEYGHGWLDFGHSNLYYKSKMKLNVTRNFNKAIANLNFIKKESTNIDKIKSEYYWFQQIPTDLSLFIPRVWGYENNEKTASYNIEFIGAPTLQEKWVFGNLPDFVYYNIINQIFDFISRIGEFKINDYDLEKSKELLNELYIIKTKNRVEQFSKQFSFDLKIPIIINDFGYPSLDGFISEVVMILQKRLNKLDKNCLTIMHGDLCFSNILIDSRSNIIKVIDPRGGLDNEFNAENKIIGDYQYDIAKVGHSLIGNYDHIVTGFYNLKKDMKNYIFEFSIEKEKRKNLENYFYIKIRELNIDEEFMKASIANLFLSMLPLHYEDKNRQLALLLNAYEFYYN